MRFKTDGADRTALGGFTLTEVMIAVLLVATGVLAATAFLGSVARSSSLTEQATGAVALGQAKIESLLSQVYPTMTGGTDIVSGYTRVWSVSNSTSAARLTVRVNWTDAGGAPHEVKMYTLAAAP
jgi:prepilin-type N-terminal cleavage/methylation domain-containing protein